MEKNSRMARFFYPGHINLLNLQTTIICQIYTSQVSEIDTLTNCVKFFSFLKLFCVILFHNCQGHVTGFCQESIALFIRLVIKWTKVTRQSAPINVSLAYHWYHTAAKSSGKSS